MRSSKGQSAANRSVKRTSKSRLRYLSVAAYFQCARRAWRVTSSVQVLWPGLQSRRQGEGQGRRREAGSEGSPIRNGGAMINNRLGSVMPSGQAGT